MTIEELIKKLEQVNPKLTVVIQDADTDWLLNINKIRVEDNAIMLIGNYKDVFAYEAPND